MVLIVSVVMCHVLWTCSGHHQVDLNVWQYVIRL